MLILKHSCFLHVPKTGGTWVKQALKQGGVDYREFAFEDDIHLGLSQCPCLDKFKFAFVRNPATLYRSYWQYKMGNGWDSRNPLERHCCSTSFHEFVEKVLRQYPGCCSRMFESFVGPEGNEIEYIGRYENLLENLLTALRMAGEAFDESAIRRCPPQNVSDKHRFQAELTPELERSIMASEQDSVKRFAYQPGFAGETPVKTP